MLSFPYKMLYYLQGTNLWHKLTLDITSLFFFAQWHINIKLVILNNTVQYVNVVDNQCITVYLSVHARLYALPKSRVQIYYIATLNAYFVTLKIGNNYSFLCLRTYLSFCIIKSKMYFFFSISRYIIIFILFYFLFLIRVSFLTKYRFYNTADITNSRFFSTKICDLNN